MSSLTPIRADLWQTLLNTRNVNPNATPESQGYFVLPDEAEELRMGRIPATWKPPVTYPEVARNDVPSTDEEEEEDVRVNSSRSWSAKEKMSMVRMRAGKVTFKVIAEKLGRNRSACQGAFYRIRDQPQYKAILDAGDPYNESIEEEEEEKEEEGKKK